MITPGELAVGQKITILQRHQREFEESDMFGGTITKKRQEDRSWYGDVLTVKAIQLPFIVVEIADSCFSSPVKMDTRELVFMELNEDYINAARRK